MPFDPFWLLLPVSMLLGAGFVVYLHDGRISAARALAASAVKGLEAIPPDQRQSIAAMGLQIVTLNARLDQARLDLQGTNARLDAHQHPHDHGADTYHVHWAKFSSTEMTNGIRRDVYTCVVPGCTSIISHTPES